MHFVRHQSVREGVVPLLCQHGWPGNFLEVLKSLSDFCCLETQYKPEADLSIG